MSAIDNLDAPGALNTKSASLKERWWYIMDTWKVGIIPLPLFILAGVLIAIDCLGQITQ